MGRVSAALVPVRAPGHSGAVPVWGAHSAADWRGFHPTAVTPTEWNPSSGLIVTANNRVRPPVCRRISNASADSPPPHRRR
jgi:penicillin amidase